MGLVIDIDGAALDLYTDTDFYITKQIHDLSDLSTRNADYTKSIVVPATSKNVDLLQIKDLFDTADAQSVIAIPCNIVMGGVPIAIEAKLYADAVNDFQDIEVAIFFGNFNFFNQIEGSIRDIDLSADAFTYDIDTIDGTNVRYQLASFVGAGGTPTQMTFQAAQPAIPLEVGQEFMWEELAPDILRKGTVTNVVSPQVYDISFQFGWLATAGTTFVTVNTVPGLKANRSGVCYAFADWFNVIGGNQFPTVSAFRYSQDIQIAGFFYYCHSLVDKIVTDAGYTLDRSAVTDVLYDEIALACPLPIFVLQESDSAIVEQNALGDVTYSAIGAGVPLVENIQFDDAITVDAETATWSGITREFTYLATPSNVFVQTLLRFTLNINGAVPLLTIRLFQNAINIQQIIYDRNSVDTEVILSGTVNAIPNDVFYVEITADGGAGGNGAAITVLGSPITVSSFELGKQGAGANRDITTPQRYLPELTTRDFLVGILEMFNIVMQTDDLEKTVTFAPFEGINDSAEQIPIVDVSQPITQSTFLSGYFRNSEFKYNEQGLFRTDTNVIFQMEDERLAIDGVVIQLPFAACDNSNLYGGFPNIVNVYANIDAYDFDGNDTSEVGWNEGIGVINFPDGATFSLGDYIGGSNGANEEFRRITNPNPSSTTAEVQGTWNFTRLSTEVSRIIELESASNKGKIVRLIDQRPDALLTSNYLTDGFLTTYVGSYTANPPDDERTGRKIFGGTDAVFDTPMLWQTLLANQYVEILTSLKTPLVVQVYLKLTVSEFDAIDFLRPIYIGEPFNARFYMNIMEQYKEDLPVRCTLIRI